jgi:hypothetical protein
MFGLQLVTATQYQDPGPLLIENQIPAGEVMRTIIQPIRHYSSEDMAVQYELVAALKFILKTPDIHSANREAVIQELDLISHSLKEGTPDRDKKRVLALINT